MLKPEINKLLNECDSAYSLVIAIAKRSRDIAMEAQDARIMLDDKPVNIAIDEFGAHKYKIVEKR
ncbi:MAG: DNA-directed RNA polymerase subunit omega [Oscillospiraceae bacterium]